MITEKDLHEAIAECQGNRNPDSRTCIKLAAYYTILDHITEKKPEPVYSYSSAPSVVSMDSCSEFAELARKMDADKLWNLMDELMDTLSMTDPRLYQAVLVKMSD